MTFKDKFHSEQNWKKKIFILELFHLTMVTRYDGKWTMKQTAKKLGVSRTLVVQDLQIAKRMNELNDCNSRIQALRKIHGK